VAAGVNEIGGVYGCGVRGALAGTRTTPTEARGGVGGVRMGGVYGCALRAPRGVAHDYRRCVRAPQHFARGSRQLVAAAHDCASDAHARHPQSRRIGERIGG
jgi:hypothetical protein